MLAVTIAVGTAYLRLAELAAESVRRFTGLQAVVLTDTPGEPLAALWKLRLLDLYPDQPVLYFDADTRFLQPWTVHAGAPFSAVLDLPSKERDADCKRYLLDPTRYVNTGLWIATTDCRPAFAEALRLCHSADYKTAFRFEQTALNVALQKSGIAIDLFDRRYNAICAPKHPLPPDPIVVHCAGGSLHGPNRTFFEKAISDAATANHPSLRP